MMTMNEWWWCLIIHQDEDSPLESTVSTYQRSFQKTEQFRVGCALCALVQDQLLTSIQVPFYHSVTSPPPSSWPSLTLTSLSPLWTNPPSKPFFQQRITAFVVLSEVYRGEGGSPFTPFLPFLADIYEKSSDPGEKILLAELLLAPPSPLSTFQAKEVRMNEGGCQNRQWWCDDAMMMILTILIMIWLIIVSFSLPGKAPRLLENFLRYFVFLPYLLLLIAVQTNCIYASLSSMMMMMMTW